MDRFRSVPVAPRSKRWMLALLAASLMASTFIIHGQASCTSQPNPVLCENALTGDPDTQWDISGAGDNTVQGFATDISVNRGDTVHFKIDTGAPTLKLDIYRLGYYAGKGARKITTISGVAGTNQPNCLTASSTGLIDCGNWAETASWAVPSTAVSGIYFAKVTRIDTGGASHIVFIVRDDAGTSDVLFQTADPTWQAYNDYGGNSLYVGGPGTNPGRAYKVSYNRPFNTRGDSAQDWLFNAEYPMVRWIEANGYNVSYFTGVDSDRFPSLLLQHRIFMSTGHDEYWSAAQRANVEAARAGGVNLAFFSGNEVFWKTRWEASIDGSGAPYRTLVSYKETHANAVIDPKDPPTWTGTWRDKRFSPPADGGKPENALTGTIFTVNCCSDGAAINVSSQFASQPFWRNTRVATLSAGQNTDLAAGTLGYEWDENLNNGSRPAGLTPLSATTITVAQKLQDNGSTYAQGTATHALTLYRHASGALVFGAGTVQWSWGLDGNHDRGGSTPDLAQQQAMVNLFSDMNAQPGSLQPGLVPGTNDTTPPTVSLTAPANGATVSGSAVTVSATASDNVGVAGVQFKLDGANLGAEDTASPYSVTWNTTTATNGTHTLTAVARDGSGNVTTSTSRTVTVSNAADSTPPTISMTAPANGATISGTATVSATASDNVAVAGVQFTLDGASLGAEDTASPYSISWNSTTATNGSHTLTAVARDAAGNTTTATSVTVTVNNVVDTTPPTVSMTAPASGATVSGTSVTVSATASDNIGVAGVQFLLDGAATGAEVTATPYAVIWNTTASVNGTHTLAARARDAAGNTTTSAGVTVTVSNTGPACPCSIWSGSTVPGPVENDVNPVELGLKFTSDVGGLISGVRFYKYAQNTGTHVGNLWSSTGTLLGSVTFTGETASGWQQMLFSSPVAVTANTTYVVSYHTNAGFYGVTSPGLTAAVNTPPLHALADGASGGNGVYLYGNNSGFPNQTWNASNYWVDVVFTTGAPDTTPPTVSLTAPANGATVSGSTVAVSATASDNVGVSGVQFKLDGANLGAEDTATPYSINWNTTTATNGSHTLTAVARDAAGNTAAATTITVTVSNDTTPPTVAMTAPTDGTTVSGSAVTVSANASDDIGVAGVQFKLDGANLGAEDTAAPYSVSWNSTTATNGSHTLTAVARDAAGNTATAATISVTVNNVDATPPTVSLPAPANGATVSGSAVTVSATASDNVGVIGVQFMLDGANFGAEDTVSPYSISWNTTTAVNGSHTLTAVARDGAGNTATATSVTVTVNNDTTVPTVSMTAPANGATVSGGAVTVSANASDNVGVAGVQFKLDGVNLGAEDTASPYSVNWNTATATNGSHTLTAVARDAAGNTATATSVTVTVSNSGPVCPCSIWSASATPAQVENDGSSVELGLKFTTDTAGKITGVRFYKYASNTGTHTGSLWSSSGTRLATVTFTGETASGWQQMLFSTPVTVTANTTYVVSYHTNTGFYGLTQPGFTTGVDNSPLHAPSNGASGGNGVYRYGASAFPNQTYQSSNYWVDVVYTP